MELAEHHSLESLRNVVSSGVKVSLSASAKERIIKCNEYLINKVEQDGPPIYGVNTGFGSLCNTEIDRKDLTQLQINLCVLTHVVRVILFLKI